MSNLWHLSHHSGSPQHEAQASLCQLSFASSAAENIFAAMKPQLLWDQGSCTQGVPRGASFPVPLPEPPADSSAQAEVTAPPKEACHTIGRDWDDSDLPCDLETSERMQMVHVPTGPRGCGSAPHPRPLGKVPDSSHIQRFEGFPWPDNLVLALTAVMGKRIFSGGHQIT